ncbi:MAG: hypothetical protein ACKVTZ_22235 [Bacteroidia bacterium]
MTYHCYNDSTHQKEELSYAGISDTTYQIYGWVWYKFWLIMPFDRHSLPVGTIKKDSIIDTLYLTKRKEGLYVLSPYYLSDLRDLRLYPEIASIYYSAKPKFWLSFDTTQLLTIHYWYIPELTMLMDGTYQLTKCIETYQEKEYVFSILRDEPYDHTLMDITEITLSPNKGLLAFRVCIYPESYAVKTPNGIEIARTPVKFITCKCENNP